ncbi:hypothetical protein, conserved [Leishmania donovani]|uniref:RING-CH-type domain-containing protein n=1 Tax=Leishmania donovani TaxID=5661 RepID=E9BMW8_LEIDO|nr:hypothetical protein, conserved [Leishmania donovani]CBZ36596.1 hypothetical protein, conserved [Leishmania donovani]
MTQFHARARGNVAPMRSRVTTGITAALLSLLVIAACFVATAVSATPPADAEDRQGATLTLLGSATVAKTARRQTSVLSRFWLHSREEQNAFTETLFGESLTKVSIDTISDIAREITPPADLKLDANLLGPLSRSAMLAATGSGVQLAASRSLQEHLTLATQADASNGQLVSKLSVLYATSVARMNEPPSAAVAQAQDPAAKMSAPQQNHRAASPAITQPLKPLKSSAQASPIESLRSGAVGVDKSRLRVPSTASRWFAALKRGAETVVRAVAEAKAGHSAIKDDSSAKVLAAKKGAAALMRTMGNYVKDTLIDVNSTRALIPITIVGSGNTVVKFNGEAGNMIEVVVQLKDHRYDKSVSRDNCYGMYLQVELRTSHKFDGGAYDSKGTAAVVATTQAHDHVGRNTWIRMKSSAKNSDIDDSSHPNVPTQEEESSRWSDFWDAFAPMLDNSAMCKVLQSVSMRVEKVQVTEPYYIILHSTTIPSLQKPQNGTSASGTQVSRFDDSPYTCELNLFFNEEPAARLGRLQFIFAFVLPLIVLFLPLPFTMRRADLVQQYMMESDFAEWIWMLPLLLRSKMVEALKAGIEWILSLRSAYQQRVLRNQLLRQEQAHQGTVAAQSATEQEQPSQQPGVQHLGWSAAAPMEPPLETPNLTGFHASAAADAQTEPSPLRQQHEPCTQCQFSEEEVSFSARSSRSTCSTPSRASAGSYSDEPHDSAHCHHHGHHTHGGRNVGALMASHSPCSSDALMEDVSCRSSTTGRTHGARRHRHHAEESYAVCEAATAVSVHVPPETDAAEHWWKGNQSGPHARSNGHDLLFTTEELVDAGRSLTTREQHQHVAGAQRPTANDAIQTVSTRPREEMEAMKSCGGAVDGVPAAGASAPMSTGITAPSAAAAEARRRAPASSAANAAPHEEEEEEESFCRICREGSDIAPLIVPCACTGSVRFVHATCLDRWRIESAKRNLANVNHCEICKEPFRVNIQRSTLLWESSQQILNGVCLFLACFIMIVTTTTLTHVVLGEMSCSASYHQVAYSTMFRFEGISLTLFVYCLAVLLVLFANLIVYSWFRSQPDVEEYVEEMHIVPPFYTRRNVLLIVLVCLVLLAQAHAMGYLLKYFLYRTSHLVWNWETSPLMGGILLSIFTIATTAFCGWVRDIYTVHVVDRDRRDAPATDVVIVPIGDADRAETAADNSNDGTAPAPLSRSIIVAGTAAPPASLTGASVTAASPPPPPFPSPATPGVSPSSPTLPTMLDSAAQQRSADEDPEYTRHFGIPPDQRVIRAFEYCPPRRKMPQR